MKKKFVLWFGMLIVVLVFRIQSTYGETDAIPESAGQFSPPASQFPPSGGKIFDSLGRKGGGLRDAVYDDEEWAKDQMRTPREFRLYAGETHPTIIFIEGENKIPDFILWNTGLRVNHSGFHGVQIAVWSNGRVIWKSEGSGYGYNADVKYREKWLTLEEYDMLRTTLEAQCDMSYNGRCYSPVVTALGANHSLQLNINTSATNFSMGVFISLLNEEVEESLPPHIQQYWDEMLVPLYALIADPEAGEPVEVFFISKQILSIRERYEMEEKLQQEKQASE